MDNAENMMNLFDELDANASNKSRDKILRAPFGYLGGKSRSVNQIIPHLPHRKVYVEAFGGTGAVLLAKVPSKLEVLNDRYMGVVAFYQCLRDKDKMEALCERLKITLHAREEFVACKESWKDVNDPVERAARWYYMIVYSFSQKGRNWGRSLNSQGALLGKIQNRLPEFFDIHERIKKVQVENQDWFDCVMDYDSYDTVFYLDPPYIDAYRGTYDHEMSHDDHRRLIDTIFKLKGFVALSGYSNPLYDNQKWDARYEWDMFVSAKGLAFRDENFKAHLKDQDERSHTKEVLWIKE